MSARSLDLDVGEGLVRPRYLGMRDRAWVAAVLAAVDRQEGRRSSRAKHSIEGAARAIGRHYAVRAPALSLLLSIERARWASRVSSEHEPARVREVVFEHAARLPRDEALRASAEVLGIDEGAIDEALYADHPDRRLFISPFADASPDAAIRRYNRRLLFELLSRSSVIEARVDDPIAIVSAAKREGLLCACTQGPRIHIGGALGVTSERPRHVAALARIVAHLDSFRARVEVDGEAATLVVTEKWLDAAPLERWDVLPALAKVLEPEGMLLEPAEAIVEVGAQVLVPDVRVRSLLGTVLVDLRPRHTEAGLQLARDAARAAAVSVVVVPYRSVSDAPSVLRALHAAWRSGPRAGPPPGPAS